MLIAFVGIAVAPAGPIVPGGPPPPPVIRPAPQPQYNDVPFTDEAVEAAILKGIKYLMDRQKPDGSWDAYSGHPVGTVAAATYVLLACSDVGKYDWQDKKIKAALQWLSTHDTRFTYDLGLRCNVWQIADKQSGGKTKEYLKNDVMPCNS